MCVFLEEFQGKVPLWQKGFKRPSIKVKNPTPKTSQVERDLSSPQE